MLTGVKLANFLVVPRTDSRAPWGLDNWSETGKFYLSSEQIRKPHGAWVIGVRQPDFVVVPRSNNSRAPRGVDDRSEIANSRAPWGLAEQSE